MRSGIKYSILWEQKREKKRRIIGLRQRDRLEREKEGREDGTGMAG